MKRVFVVVILAVLLMVLASCAPGPNSLADSKNEDGNIAGFWDGLWQGIIAPITFIISLFNHNVEIYEVHNNGGWYNFGYLLGMGIILGGGSGGAARSRH